MNKSSEGFKIVFGGDKGGTGKTTGAVSLASSLASRGYSVALLDSDTKLGAVKWHTDRLALIENLRDNPSAYTTPLPSGRQMLSNTMIRKLEKTTLNPITCESTTGHIHRTILSLAAEHDFVVVDTAGGIKNELTSALAVADIVVSPFKASSFDLQTVEELSILIDKMSLQNPKLKAFCYLNEVPIVGYQDIVAVAKSYLREFPHLQVFDTLLKTYASHRNSNSFGASVIEWDDAKAKAQVSFLTDEVLQALGA